MSFCRYLRLERYGVLRGTYCIQICFLCFQPDIGYPLTPEGQQAWTRDFLKFVMETPEVSGCIYFYPEYYPNFSKDARFQGLNAAGLFTETLKPNAALKEFNKYKTPLKSK